MKQTKVAIYILLCVVWNYSALPDTTDEHFDRARELMNTGNYEKAADEFKAIGRLAADDSIMAQNAAYWIGQCYLKMKQYDDALLTFERIVADYPESSLVSVTRAMIDRTRQEKEDEEFRARMDAASEKSVIVDQETGLTFTRIFSSDKLNLLSHNRGLQLSTDGRFLFDYLGHWIIPLKDGEEPFSLGSDTVDVFFGSWSPDMTGFAYIAEGSKDLFLAPISPATGRPTGPAKLLVKGENRDSIRDNFMPAWSPDGKQITFPLLRNGNVDIWTIQAAGGEPVRMTDDPREERRPVWSPDGRNIVFGRKRDLSDERRWDIFTVAAQGGIPEKMMEDAYIYGFSPDGEWFAFARAEEKGMDVMRLSDRRQFHIEPPELVVGEFSQGPKSCWASEGSKLLFYNSGFEYWETMGLVLPYGGSPMELGKDARLSSWAQGWSPDGKFILTLDWETNDLWVVPTDGGTPAKIKVETQPEIWRYAVQPFSPDLKKVSFVTKDGTLWVLPISIEERRVTGPAIKIAEEIRGPRTADVCWSPDSKWMAFSSLKGGNADVWIASADGRELKQLTSDPEEEIISGWRYGSAWSSKRDMILYGKADVIWVIPAFGGEAREVVKNADEPVWSPDGREVGFINRNDLLISIVTLETGEIRNVVDLKNTGMADSQEPDSGYWGLTWSPDGKWLSFFTVKMRTDHLWVVPVAGGKPEELASSHPGKWYQFWSPDGSMLSYNSDRDVRVRMGAIWEMDVDQLLNREKEKP